MFDCYCIPMNVIEEDTKLTPDEVLDLVCRHYRQDREKVVSKVRTRELVKTRQVYCHLAHKFTDHSLKSIGEVIGGRDHTTVIHSKGMVDTALQELDEWGRDIATDVKHLGSLLSNPFYKIA